MYIRTNFIRSTVVVYSNYLAKCFTVSGSNPIGGIIFLVFWSTYVRYRRKKVHVRYLSSPDEFLYQYFPQPNKPLRGSTDEMDYSMWTITA